MKYTTDNTTTHIASTKCQYMANTPMRSRVFLPHMSQRRKDHDDGQSGGADDHVKRMQPDQRIKRGAKQISADRQSLVVDQPMPFARRAQQEDHAQHDGQQPEGSEALDLADDAALSRPSKS